MDSCSGKVLFIGQLQPLDDELEDNYSLQLERLIESTRIPIISEDLEGALAPIDVDLI